MKKLVLLLLLPFLGFSQAMLDEGIQLGGNAKTTTAKKVVMQENDGILNYKDTEVFTENSAGALSGFALTNNGNGTVNIASGSALLRSTASEIGTLQKYQLPAVTNLTLTDNANNYILASYNGGTPAVTVTTDVNTINTTTNTLLYVVARVGNKIDHAYAGEQNVDSNGKLRRRFLNTEAFARAQGGILSFTNRNLTVTTGLFYSGLTPYVTAAFNTAGADAFTNVYNNASVWTRQTGQAQVNNTQYNLNGTLTTMTNGRFRVDYVYFLVNNPTQIYTVMGSTQYTTLALARLAPLPSALPVELQRLGVLLGRVIIEKDATTISEVASAFTTVFAASSVLNHNDTANLQGGALGDYQHITTAEKASFTDKVNKSGIENSLPILDTAGNNLGAIETNDDHVSLRGVTGVLLDAPSTVVNSLSGYQDYLVGVGLDGQLIPVKRDSGLYAPTATNSTVQNLVANTPTKMLAIITTTQSMTSPTLQWSINITNNSNQLSIIKIKLGLNNVATGTAVQYTVPKQTTLTITGAAPYAPTIASATEVSAFIESSTVARVNSSTIKLDSGVSALQLKTVGGQSLFGTGNVTEVQNSLSASSILAPSVDAVNSALSGKQPTISGTPNRLAKFGSGGVVESNIVDNERGISINSQDIVSPNITLTKQNISKWVFGGNSGEFTDNFNIYNYLLGKIVFSIREDSGNTLFNTATDNGNTVQVNGNITALPATQSNQVVVLSQISGLAPLASPALTGVPTAPTATAGTNTTQVATTAFVFANAMSIPHLKFNNTDKTVWNNGKGDFQSNTVFGEAALLSNTTGTVNTAFGTSSLSLNTTGNVNTAIGRDALIQNTTGSSNTAIGSGSLQSVSTGGNNTAVGALAGNLSGGTAIREGVFIGSSSRPFGTTSFNEIVIGYNAIGAGINTATLGNTSITSTILRGNVSTNGNVTATAYNLSALNTAPASATATGTTGEIRYTATHIYVCTATNTWVRTALTTW
jgi:hypothetical protein